MVIITLTQTYASDLGSRSTYMAYNEAFNLVALKTCPESNLKLPSLSHSVYRQWSLDKSRKEATKLKEGRLAVVM